MFHESLKLNNFSFTEFTLKVILNSKKFNNNNTNFKCNEILKF
jgi:hypothetical protein